MGNTEFLEKMGFRYGKNGPHSSRTMMFDELSSLFSASREESAFSDYRKAVVEDNLLGKPSQKARKLTWRHIAELYGFRTEQAVFRTFRKLWSRDKASQPLLALLVALVRDPLFRRSEDFILRKRPGELVKREELEKLLASEDPTRFSQASLRSFAQNINGTWTQAGFLEGRVRKIRSVPEVTHIHVAFSLFLAYLEGATGQLLFSSRWVALLGVSPEKLELLATSAANRGLLVFMNAGGVKEVRFPGWLTPEEEKWRMEQSNV